MPLAVAAAACTIAARAAIPITAVPPADYQPAGAAPVADAPLRASAARALRVDLPAAAADGKRALQREAASDGRAAQGVASKHRPHVIGYPRDVPAPWRRVALAGLDWQTLADGSRVARVDVRSPGAAGVRVTWSVEPFAPGLGVRFAGKPPGAAVHSAQLVEARADRTARGGRDVSPVLEGDTAIVELSATAGTALGEAALVLGPASHLVVAGPSLRDIASRAASGIGSAGACNIDLACVAPSEALRHAADSVGKLVFSDAEGYTYACGGTLLNDSLASSTPYVLTAAHCIGSAYEAATTNVYWFFRARSCGSVEVPPYVLQAGGATLLARSDDLDWALIRLDGTPPPGVRYAAWRAEPVPALAVGTGLHHPHGDLAKYSQGSAYGHQTFADGASFLAMRWSHGTTEVGSSGSGLFTYHAQGGHYELRGGLYGGDASCGNRTGVDYYTRLDTLLPLVREYLTPDVPNPAQHVVVVEYHHRGLDRHFLTADAGEIGRLDSGAIAGWQRTGVRFLAYGALVAGASPVCRHYLPPAAGNAHFYSADPAECANTGEGRARAWISESPAVFHVPLPDPVTGACPGGTRALWRFLASGAAHHRYTPEATLRDALRADPRWIAEGYGPDKAVMCLPTGLPP